MSIDQRENLNSPPMFVCVCLYSLSSLNLSVL